MLPALAVLISLACATSAQAYTYVLRPDTTITNAWNAEPAGAIAHTVLDDPVLAPGAPAPGKDFLQDNGNGPLVVEVGLQTIALRPAENVTRARSWANLQPGDARSIDGELRTGATVLSAATVPAGAPAGWYTVDSTTAVTQAQLDDLRQRATLQGTGASTNGFLYAAYVELTTDMPPPAPTITGGPSAAGTATAATWSFTATPAAGFECRLEQGATVRSDWTACSAGATYDLSTWGDGDYTFRVRAIDDVGTAGAETARLYTLDRVAPAAPAVTSSPASPGNGSAPSWSFTAEPGALTSCRLTRGATVISDWALCSSPAAYDLAAETDGTYSFQVNATDMAGNTGPDATSTYVLDRAAPAAPTFTAQPPGAGNGTSPSWSFTAEAGAAFSCRLERGAALISDWASCSSPRSYDLSSQGDGTYTFRVKATDAAGNVSGETVGSYVLDRAAPVAPTITSGPAASSNNASPSWAFTAEAGATTGCRLTRGATVVSDWGPCVSPRSYSLGVEPDGTYLFEVRATDAAANTGPVASQSYTLDRAAPAAPVITGAPSSYSSDPTPVVSFTYEPGATASCRLERGATILYDWAPCSSPYTRDLSGQPDGTYTWRVRATDAAGNTGAETGGSYTLDRVAPNQPALTGRPNAITNDDTPTYSWPPDPDIVTFNCRLERGATIVQDWTTCASPRTYDLTAQPDGVYKFRFRGSDAAANSSTETTDTFALDRVPPAAPSITSGPTGASTNQTPSYAFTAEAGATTECRIERGATVVSDWGPCTSPRSYDLSLQPDGAYTFRVRATDTAGNTGADATRAYTLDRTAPAAPTITSGPPADSNDPTPVYGFSGEPGATFSCRLTRGAAVISGWAPCSTPQGYDLTGDLDGTYTFEVRATDPAGNTGSPASRAYALDRVPPPAPTLTATPGAATNTSSPSWSYTTLSATGTDCRLERGATVVSDWASCASPKSYALAAQPDGTYTFRVRAYDAAGNVGAETADSTTVDRAVPAAPTITGGPPSSSSDASPAYTFTAETGASTACRIERGATVVSDWSACASPRTYDLSAEVDGVYTFRVRATDAAGNTSPDASRAYTLDRVAPPAPPIAGRPPASTNSPMPQWSWSSDPDATSYRCRLTNGATIVRDWATCSSPKVYDLSSEVDGVYTFHVRASDPAANESTESTDSFALDRAAPDAPSITGAPAADSSDDTPTYAFTAEPGAATTCRVERGATVVSDWAPCTSAKTYDITAQPDGTYTFRVRATDDAGNTGADASRAYALDRSAPAAPSIDAGPTGDSTDQSPTYAFTAETGAITECRIERGATVVADWATCASPKTYGLAAEPDGTYTFRVRATDAAGNTGAPAARTYVLDRTAPDAPAIGSGPAPDSVDDSPTYAFTAEAGAALSCRLERGATVVEDWTSCTSPRTYDLSADVDGTYTFRVRATDAAGNTGADAARSYNLDRTVPIAPTLDARPGDDGNDRSPRWAFSGEPGKTFECRLARGATLVEDWTDCTSPRSYDLSLQPDGTYAFSVRARNAAGTRSPVTSDLYRFDTSAPAAPGLSAGPAPDSVDDTPSWAISAEPGATLACRLERSGTVVSAPAPCTSPIGYDLTSEPDGTYTVFVAATDAAGNTGAEGSATYNLDRTVPASPTFGSQPPAAGSDTDPVWTFTAEPGKTFVCRLLLDGAVLDAWASCTSPYTRPLAAEADGTYTFEVEAVNAAGTHSPTERSDYVLDRAAPAAPTITGGPPADSSDDTPSWTFTAEPGAAFSCRLERGATVVRAWTACTSPEDEDLSAEVDGVYTFRVRATDAAGNTGPDQTRSYTLDRTVPGPAAFVSRPASPASDRTPRWGLAKDTGMALECEITRGPDGVVAWTACSDPYTAPLATEPDGAYTLHVRQFNAAGTRGPEITDGFVLDTTAPSPPDVTGRPGAAGNDSDPAWQFTAETGATLECRLERGGVEVRAWAACTTPRSYALAGEPDGEYVFSVRATDAAGNVGAPATDAHLLDRVPPVPPAITAGPGPLGNGRAVAWSFTGEPGAAFECRFDVEDTPLEPYAPCTSPRGQDLARRPDGAYAFGVRAVDAAGNRSEPTFAPYRLDTTPGAVTIDSGPGPLGRDRAPRWTYTAEEGAAVACRLDEDGASVFDWAPCALPATYDLTGRADGVFRVSLRATDAAGNQGPVSDAAYELDTTPPDAPTIEDRPASPGTDRTPSWRFSGERGATFACRVQAVGSGDAGGDWAACVSPFSADLVSSQDGRYRFAVRATDRAGNTGPWATDDIQLVQREKADPAPPPTDPAPKAPVEQQESDAAAPKTGPEPTPRPRRKVKAAAPVAPPKRTPPAAPRRHRERRAPAKAAPRTAVPRRAADDKAKGGLFGRAGRAVRAVARAVVENPDKTVFPFSLIMIVLVFLAIQNRLDRSDPKLALAPSFAEPDLEFPPPKPA